MFNIRKRHAKPLKIVAAILAVAIVGLAYYGYTLYQKVMTSNVQTEEVIYLPTGSNYQSLLDSLERHNVLKDKGNFEWVADKMNLEDAVKPGRYRIKPGQSNRELVNMFRGGLQEPVLVHINKKRTKEEFADYIATKLELNKDSLLHLLHDEAYLDQFDLTPETALTLFISDSYEFWWTTTAREFMQKMQTNHDAFWTEDRIAKADKWGLTPQQAVILASIVEEETAKEDEKPKVARLYLNRLEENWALQADPTVKYALGDFGLKRILFAHLEVMSPYNTYKVKGLPPGPICIPFKNSIEAVLNPAEHDYMFMCAKDDFSGYHNFARTHREHERNRQQYIRALNDRNIR